MPPEHLADDLTLFTGLCSLAVAVREGRAVMPR
jgi:hypothetical protein